jgi:gamma-glutamyltranspeptidase/glutathione hydrolase
MIASNERRASDAGNEIIRAGGNAVDAAVARDSPAVTYPVAGTSAGGFMAIRWPTGRVAAIDYAKSPRLPRTGDMYLTRRGTRPTRASGYRASGVPGAVADGRGAAKYGTMTLSQVMQPAIRFARDGFTVDSR